VGWTMNFVPVLVAVVLVALFFRDNVLAYPLAIFGMHIAGGLMDLFAQHHRFYRQNGLALTLLAGIVLVWALRSTAETTTST